MAARLGVEPRQNESESFVLPLHHRAVKNLSRPAGLGGPPSLVRDWPSTDIALSQWVGLGSRRGL